MLSDVAFLLLFPLIAFHAFVKRRVLLSGRRSAIPSDVAYQFHARFLFPSLFFFLAFHIYTFRLHFTLLTRLQKRDRRSCKLNKMAAGWRKERNARQFPSYIFVYLCVRVRGYIDIYVEVSMHVERGSRGSKWLAGDTFERRRFFKSVARQAWSVPFGETNASLVALLSSARPYPRNAEIRLRSRPEA